MQLWQTLYLEITAVLGVVLTVVTVTWVLMTKKNSTSAVAWCLLVFFVPIVGSLFFLIFGYQQIHRPLRRKQKHKKLFRLTNPAGRQEAVGPGAALADNRAVQDMARLAQRFGAFPVTTGNRVVFYYEGAPAFAAKLAAIRLARHHVHLEYFIIQPDEMGREFLEVLAQKAREGVEVRLLYDAMGSHRLYRRTLQPLLAAGGKCSVFLPLNPFRRRIQVNMRDHRKLLIIDGRIAFTGGLNIGDEYVGKNPYFGFWRDTHVRLEGPVAASLQRVFIEGWDFAADENLQGPGYFPELEALENAEGGSHVPMLPSPPDAKQSAPLLCPVQVIQSGPDQELKSIRESYFAAMLRARKRLWIASPYFVPDAGILDALCFAAYAGVDVRLLCQFHPDKWIPFFAGRYYWDDVLEAGVKVYQYKKGMMHSKMLLVDGAWASVGTANLDNRSLHLNFEVNCLIYAPAAVAELERAFEHDLSFSIRLQKEVFARRPFAGRLLDNACRLLSPIL